MIVLALKTWDLLKALATPRNLVAALVVFAMVQTVRIGHIKHDLAHARMDLINPLTKRPWQREAQDAQASLTTCKANTEALKTAIGTQNKATQRLGDLTASALTLADQNAATAKKSALAAQKAADQILAQRTPGATACERAEAARAKYVESLK